MLSFYASGGNNNGLECRVTKQYKDNMIHMDFLYLLHLLRESDAMIIDLLKIL